MEAVIEANNKFTIDLHKALKNDQNFTSKNLFYSPSSLEQQKKALFAALSRKDVFTILSTGHGKYIIFQSLPDVCEYLSLRGYSYPRHAIILVVCPLKSLVDSHIRELRNRGVYQFEQSRR